MMDVFKEYQNLLEDLFDDFFDKYRESQEAFYSSCRDICKSH
jgi:hypothetical protein